MLDSLSFLHSSPPVFSSANTGAPPFFNLYFILRKIPNPSKSKGKIGVGCSERCSLDQLSFFPLLLGWGQFLSFLILMILRRLDRLQFKPELPFSSEFLEKFSARVQIRTPHSTFLFNFVLSQRTT